VTFLLLERSKSHPYWRGKSIYDQTEHVLYKLIMFSAPQIQYVC